MSLSDLSRHTPAQQSEIDRLVDIGYLAKEPYSLAWTPFKESVWGKKLDSFQTVKLVERDPQDPIEDPSIPPGSVPDKTWVTIIPNNIPVLWGASSNQMILTRSEYDEAEEAALSANKSGANAFVVTGQPGIGPPPNHSITHRN